MQYQVMQKLKQLKDTIKKWRKESGTSPKSKVAEAKSHLKDIHKKLNYDLMNPSIHKEESDTQAKLRFWLAKEEEDNRQKSRENWLGPVDKNKNFFYNACKVRNY